jgi:hypothetical protein
MAKKPKIDPTSFNFGANRKARGRKRKRGKKSDAWRAYTGKR